MKVERAYELIDIAITDIANDFWIVDASKETILKNVGYLLGFADGVRKAIQQGDDND